MPAGAPVGNQNAVKAKRWQKALEKALARAGEGDLDAGLSPIADAVVLAARNGDKDAWREIGDRLDGKPAQAITGADGGPFQVAEIRHTIIDPAKAE